MVKFPQTMANLTEATTNLYDIIKGRNLIVLPTTITTCHVA